MLYKLQHILLKKPFASIVAFHIFTRIIIAVLYWHVTIFPDTEGYVELAQRLINLNISGYEGYRSPGYPILLALSGNVLWVAVLLQIICGAITAVYQYKTLLLLNFTKKHALYTALAINSLIHIIFYEFAILTETLTLLFITLCFYNIFKIFNGAAGTGQFLFTGLLSGYLVFIKPFYIFLPFLIYAFYTLKDFSLKKIINRSLLLLFFPLLSYLGWSYVNKINTGYFTSTTFLGINLSQNCVYFAEAAHEEYPLISDIYVKHREEAIKNNKDVAMTIWYAQEELQQQTGLSLVDLSYTLNGFSKAAIKNNPGAYAKQALLSWREFWFSAVYWNYSSFNFTYSNKLCNGIWYIQRAIIMLFEIIFILLIPYYIFQFAVKRKITPTVIISLTVFAASVLQAMVTFGTNSRFSFPFEPLLFVCVLLFFKEQQAIRAKAKS